MNTRRNFLKKGGLIALVPIVPIKLIETPEMTRALDISKAVTPHQLRPGEFFVAVRALKENVIYAAHGIASEWEFKATQNLVQVDNSLMIPGRTPRMIPGKTSRTVRIEGTVNQWIEINPED